MSCNHCYLLAEKPDSNILCRMHKIKDGVFSHGGLVIWCTTQNLNLTTTSPPDLKAVKKKKNQHTVLNDLPC